MSDISIDFKKYSQYKQADTVCEFLSLNRLERIPGGRRDVTSSPVTWAIGQVTSDLKKEQIRSSFEFAFKQLSVPFDPIEFIETQDYNSAKIKLDFAFDGDVILPFPFGRNTLAYVPTNALDHVYFNDIYDWSEIFNPSKIFLAKTAVHEIMHSLGFGHSTITNDILEPVMRNNSQIFFSNDTKQAISADYKTLIDRLNKDKTFAPPVATEPRAEQSELDQFIDDFFKKRFQLLTTRNEQLKVLGKALGIEFKTRRSFLKIIREKLGLK